MSMIMEGCQGKPQIKIYEKTCPNCGAPIEIFSIDAEMACEKCGYVIYNDTLNCVQWCKYAKECVGEKVYENMMQIAARKKAEEAEKKAEEAQKKAEASSEKKN